MAPYLNPEKVKAQAGLPVKPGEKTYEVVAYDRLIYWVIPSPRSTRDIADMDKQYNAGHYVNKRVYTLPASFLNNPKNWNMPPAEFDF